MSTEPMTISGKRMHVSSAAEEIAGNEDLLTEILLRLPVKSLLRFESVTKKWLSLISHPHFSQNYSRLHNPNYQPSGLLLNHYSLNYSRLHNPNYEPFRLLWDNYCADFQFLPFNGDGDGDRARVRLSHPDDPGIRIFQSCNGLLLCSSLIYSYPKFEYYICNPTTKQFATISFPIPNLAYNEFDVNLAFDPLKSPYYKLLCIRKLDEETRAFQIDIYSSETGSWRPPISGDPLIFTAPQGIALTAPVYWRGALHWYSDEQTSLYFNTDTECLKTMPMPPFEDDCFDFSGVRYFGESRGHLHITMIPQPSASEFDIWELETDYSGWFIRYRVNLDAVMIAFPLDVTEIRDELTNAFSILWVDRAEKEEESTLVLFVSGKAISFNLHKNTSKKLCDLVPCQKPVPLSLDYEWNGAYQYIETLFHV